MATKLIRHPIKKLASLNSLASFLQYVTNEGHKNHKNIKLGVMQFFNCKEASKKGFMKEVRDADVKYKASLKGKRGCRSKKLWEQIVFSTPYDAFPTAERQRAMEKVIIEKVCKNTACVLVPHFNPRTGRLDEHLILAAKTKDEKPVLTRNKFFNGRHFSVALEDLDKAMIGELNKGLDKSKQLKTASERHKEIMKEKNGGVEKFNLAKKIVVKGLEVEELAAAVKSLGGKVTKESKRNISIVFNGKTKPRRYNKEKLENDIDCYLDGVFIGELLAQGKRKEAREYLKECLEAERDFLSMGEEGTGIEKVLEELEVEFKDDKDDKKDDSSGGGGADLAPVVEEQEEEIIIPPTLAPVVEEEKDKVKKVSKPKDKDLEKEEDLEK
jgi:hypothetical protein